MLIASNPKLLLLDEPTTGMTEEGKRKTAELIRKIAKTHTVLLVEHDMHIVRQIGQRISPFCIRASYWLRGRSAK